MADRIAKKRWSFRRKKKKQQNLDENRDDNAERRNDRGVEADIGIKEDIVLEKHIERNARVDFR